MNEAQRKTAEGALFTDHYQLTMGQLYFRLGLHERNVQFDYFFRSYPDYGNGKAGYCISAGLEWLLNWMQAAHFRERDLEYLRQMKTATGRQLFDDDFLEYLRRSGDYSAVTMRAIPEGRVVHPNVPLVVVQGPLLIAQLLETPLLNHLNYPTLVATKAARIRQAGLEQTLLEFGMRRGHERGVNAGTRAAMIGGADFTSNSGISYVLGYPPQGTHAHSLVQLFLTLAGDEAGELEAFRAYADLYPDDCLLLVDTVDTLRSGIPNAIRVFEELRRKGHKPVGVRLDSGDLAYLAVQAAKMMNAAGFEDTSIVLSDSLDEMVLLQIISQIQEEAPHYGLDADGVVKRLVYGVGTRLITSRGSSALGGVYKLVAVQGDQTWQPAIKISENPAKTPNPGNKSVWRLYDKRGNATADLMTLDDEQPPSEMEEIKLHHPVQAEMRRVLSKDDLSEVEPLHELIVEDGSVRYQSPSIEEMRALRQRDLARLDPGVRRLIHPHIYHVSLSSKLWQLKQSLVNSLER